MTYLGTSMRTSLLAHALWVRSFFNLCCIGYHKLFKLSILQRYYFFSWALFFFFLLLFLTKHTGRSCCWLWSRFLWHVVVLYWCGERVGQGHEGWWQALRAGCQRWPGYSRCQRYTSSQPVRPCSAECSRPAPFRCWRRSTQLRHYYRWERQHAVAHSSLWYEWTVRRLCHISNSTEKWCVVVWFSYFKDVRE